MLAKTFSPKELADIIGVSESSIKRWGDAGMIELARTAGGHRRIGFHEALRFIRGQQLQIVRPDLLGLPDLAHLSPEVRTGELSEASLYEVLKTADAVQARGLILAAYLDGADLSSLFDGPVSGALSCLGALWEHDERGIFLEHVATNICIEALNLVHLLLPPASKEAPVALGGAPEQDPYLLPSLMAATVLADAGYSAINLGPQTPVDAFHQAVAMYQPNLVWIAVKNELPTSERNALINDLINPLQDRGIEVVAGGEGAQKVADAWPAFVPVLSTMEALAAYARNHVE